MVKQIVKLGGILCIITFIVVLILGYVNSVTKDIIAQNAQKTENEAKAQLVAADTFEEIDEGIFVGKKQGAAVGYCVKGSTKGYGGDMVILAGFNADLSLCGIKITEHSETAGLGAKAAQPEFSEKLKGKEPALSVNKSGGGGKSEVDAISGATITTTAVTDCINECYARLCAALER